MLLNKEEEAWRNDKTSCLSERSTHINEVASFKFGKFDQNNQKLTTKVRNLSQVWWIKSI